MSENKAFQFALLASLLVHSVFFLGIPHLPFMPSRKSMEDMEIVYYKFKEPLSEKKTVAEKKEPIVKKLPKVKKEEILEPAKQAPKEAKSIKKMAPAQVIDKVEGKKFEAVIQEEQDASKKATYISYYKAVREKIKQCVDRNYPRNRNLGEGEVFLSFIVASSGELLQAKVVDEKSINNASLRNIAINSIRDASPFPPFPEGMSQYEITFNVIISFELAK